MNSLGKNGPKTNNQVKLPSSKTHKISGGYDCEGHRAEAQPGADIRAGQRDHQDVHHGSRLSRHSGPEGAAKIFFTKSQQIHNICFQ